MKILKLKSLSIMFLLLIFGTACKQIKVKDPNSQINPEQIAYLERQIQDLERRVTLLEEDNKKNLNK